VTPFVVEISNLSKSYTASDGQASVVLSGVNMQIAAGETVAIVGESAVGKSTPLNCIGGLDDASAGALRVCGADLAALDADQRALLRREKIGFVFQAFHVLPHLDVAANIGLPLMLLKRPKREREQAVAALHRALD
jgi:putative ABC transport system ATP-binding protein